MTSTHTPNSTSSFVEFLSVETMTIIDDEMQRMWGWTSDPHRLPQMYDQLLINTNKCQISNKRSMYHKVFCENKFRIGDKK